jgi:PAS domain S-box-containing protein
LLDLDSIGIIILHNLKYQAIMTTQSNLFTDPSSSDQVNNILSYWDKDMICRFANNQFTKWFGRKPSELIGRTTLKELLGTAYQLHLSYIKKVFEGNTEVYEYEMLFFSGDRYLVTATYYPDVESGYLSGFFLHIVLKKPRQLLHSKKNESYFVEIKNKHHNININNKMPEVAQFLETRLLSGFPSIEYIADLHHISVSKLMRDFKSAFKTSPFIYYRKLQMEYAHQYLHETGCSKKQIALLLGFSNPGNFTSCYNRWIRTQQVRAPKTNCQMNIEDQNRMLINQLPVAIAMVDSEMNYLVVSKKWVTDFNLSGIDLIKKNLFDFFPDKDIKWRRIEKQCLAGEIKNCEKDYFEDKNGKRIWLKWDIRPWYDDYGKIGGLIIYASKIRNIINEHKQLYFEHQ